MLVPCRLDLICSGTTVILTKVFLLRSIESNEHLLHEEAFHAFPQRIRIFNGVNGFCAKQAALHGLVERLLYGRSPTF